MDRTYLPSSSEAVVPAMGDAAEGFAVHLDTEFAAVFAFLWDPSVDATNWRAEQAIRRNSPAVVTLNVGR